MGRQSDGRQWVCLNLSHGHTGGHTQRCMDTGDGQILNQMADVVLRWNLRIVTMSSKR